MEKVSLIIPTFNRKDLLELTLNNILQQTRRPSEIIVIDDHSSDGTSEFVRLRFGSDVMVTMNKGKGPGAARNTGFSIATGEYIKFFDSDDLMTSNMIDVQVHALQSSHNAFVYSPYFFACQDEATGWKVKNDVILNYFPLKADRPLWHYMMVDGLFITIPGMLFKRALLKEVGPWREDVVAYEDWDYLFRISKLEPFPLHTNACAFLYRLHGQQTTVRNFSNSRRDRDKNTVLTDLYQAIQNDSRYSWFEKLLFRNKFYQLYHDGQLAAPLKGELRAHNSTLQKIVWGILRAKLKYGRSITKTDWQPCHGPLRSGKQISSYLSFIN